jgi:hypothetical protein
VAAVEHETVTIEELRDRLDELSRATLGISGTDFLWRYQAGELSDGSPAIARLTMLAGQILAAGARAA